MRIWRVLLRLSAELHDFGDVQAIDATGMDRIAASQHYAKRTNYTFEAVKTTLLTDCETGAILDIYCSMKQSHDSKIGWQMVKRNLDKLNIRLCSFGTPWSISRISDAPAEVVDGRFQQHLTELQPPVTRTHGSAERALD